MVEYNYRIVNVFAEERLAGNPLKFSAFADPTTRSPAPELDGDRAAILKELGL